MKPSEALAIYRNAIVTIVENNHTRNPKVFGSVLYCKDTEESDLDILVETTPDTTLLDIARIQNQLCKIMGVQVDVLTPKALPERFRDQVMLEARPI